MHLRRFRARFVVALTAALAIPFAAALAFAAPDDRAAAEASLRDVEASPRKAAASELVARSRAALDRAGRMRAAGDEPHARLADRVARTWAEAARDVVRAAELEDKAQAARRAAADAGVVADRERALLEEAIAQSGRLRAQLDATSREGKDQPARTSTAVDADAGTKPPRSAAPAKDGGPR